MCGVGGLLQQGSTQWTWDIAPLTCCGGQSSVAGGRPPPNERRRRNRSCLHTGGGEGRGGEGRGGEGVKAVGKG